MKALLFIILVVAYSTSTQHAIKAIQAQKHKQSQFLDYFHGLLELRKNDKLEEVVGVVNWMLEQLQTAQTVKAAEYETKSAGFQTRLDALQNSLEEQENELEAVNLLVGDLSTDLASLTQSLSFQTKQITLINKQIAETIDSRQAEETSANQKLSATEKQLDAVKEIVRYLNENTVWESFAEKEVAVNKLKSVLGDRHPIALMVEFTSKFDKDTIKRVLAKIEAIQQKLEDTIARVQENDAKSQQTFQIIITQLEENSNKLGEDLKANQRQTDAKSADLLVNQRRQGELTQSIEETQQLLEQTRIAAEDASTNYTAIRSILIDQISVVQSALDLLKQFEQQQN